MSTFLKLLNESLNSSKISKEEYQKLTDEYNNLSDADKDNYDKTPMVFLPIKKDKEIKANEKKEEFTYSIEERVRFLENKISAFSKSATSNILKTIGLFIINAVINYFLINKEVEMRQLLQLYYLWLLLLL